MSSRKLGKVESFYYGFEKAKMYNSFNVSATYSPKISPASLSVALKNIVSAHPLLISNIQSADFTVKVIDSIRYGDVVHQFKGESTLEETLNKLSEIKLPYDTSTLPLWRIYRIDKENSTQLNIIFDHSVFDGMSGTNFHKILIRELNKISSQSNLTESDFDYNVKIFNKVEQAKSIGPLPSPIEELIDLTPKSKLEFPAPPNVWQSNSISQVNSTHIFKTVHLSKSQNLTLKNLCKTKKVKVSAFIEACFFAAHGTTQKDFDPTKFKTVGYGVNARPEISESKAESALFGANVMSEFSVYPSINKFTWDHCAAISDNIEKRLKDGSYKELTSAGCYGVPPEMWEQFHVSNILGKPRGTLILNSLGYQEMNTGINGKFNITEVYFSQSAYAMSLAYCMSCIASEEGMNIVLTLVSDSNEVQKFDELVSVFNRLLLQSI